MHGGSEKRGREMVQHLRRRGTAAAGAARLGATWSWQGLARCVARSAAMSNRSGRRAAAT
eukprot:2358633-Pyramimonas_sp.AAC.1